MGGGGGRERSTDSLDAFGQLPIKTLQYYSQLKWTVTDAGMGKKVGNFQCVLLTL